MSALGADAYKIPDKVKAVLDRCMSVTLIPGDGSQKSSRFPSMVILMDDKQLPQVPAARDRVCDDGRNTLFEHIILDSPLGVFRTNVTSAKVAAGMKPEGEGLRHMKAAMPKPHHDSLTQVSGGEKTNFAIVIEDNCDDVEEHAAFGKLAESWADYVVKNREKTASISRIF